MSIEVQRSLDFGGARRITNLPDGVGLQEPATVAQLNAAVEGIAWKDSVRVSTQANVSLASPGATVDGITMTANDRVLVRAQTTASENGIYIWNGAATLMTRAPDASTSNELEQAVVTVEEGTNAGASYRQTLVNFSLGSGSVAWTSFGSSAGAASTSSSGLVQIATQAEVNTGTETLKVVTPETLAASVLASKKYTGTMGDGSATSITITHNLGTRALDIEVYRNSGNYDTVLVETQRPTINTVTFVFDTAPAAAAFAYRIST